MKLDSLSKRLTFASTLNDFTSKDQLSEQPKNAVLEFLERRALELFLRFYLYIGWVVLVILTILPIFSSSLRPFWRITCWVAPTLLAVEVNAGNRTWVYVSKIAVWILQVALTQYMLNVTNGFRKPSDLQRIVVSFLILLFLASCVLTVIGLRQKNTVWFRDGLVHVGANLRPIDKTVYANLQQHEILVKLSKHELEHAWTSSSDMEVGRRLLTEQEVSHHVIRTSLVTQFVVARVFKNVIDRVFVYSPVTHYRTIMFTVALILAGLVHIGQDLFEFEDEREVVTTMILWLTLPSITLPSLVRIKFGNHATLSYMLRGLLPVDTDIQMSQRLGISPQDLYTALTNAFSAERVLKDSVGLAEGFGKGTVKVNNTKEANGLCIKSLLRVGDMYVRVSDGKRFGFFRPRELKNLSELSCLRHEQENSNRS